MKLESLKNGIFAESTLKSNQLFALNGGGTATPAGSGCGTGTSASRPDVNLKYDFGYDVIRTREDGTTYTTYHNRTNVQVVANCNG